MTYFEIAKNKILNEGYFILREKFTDGTVIFSIVRQEAPDTKSVYGEIAYNIANLLEKETGKSIVNSEHECVALNFKPSNVKHNCIRQTIFD